MFGRAVRNARPPAPSASDRLSLREGVACCLFEDCAIVLDRRADRYWRLGARAAHVLAWISGDLHAAMRPGDFEPLHHIGVLEQRADSRRQRPASFPEPERSLLEQRADPQPFQLSLALQVFGSVVATHLLLRVKGFDDRLSAVERRRGRHSSRASNATLQSLAQTFERYRRFVPLKRVCLADSLALLRFLRRHGHGPALVLGVAAYPFAAHCWLQDGETVVNDALDHARLFKPILTL